MKRELKFKGKKVLIFGLGLLGGGIEAAKWFYKNGAKIIITDKKTKKELLLSIKRLKKIKAKYVLGKHRFEDIDRADIVYFNPGVSYKSEWVKYAKKKGKEVVNDCYIFFKYAKGDIIAITGTRGKTTTTTWIYELLTQTLQTERRLGGQYTDYADLTRTEQKSISAKSALSSAKSTLLGGNQPEKSLFKILDKTKEDTISVLEISSFQLEFYPTDKCGFVNGFSRINDHPADKCRFVKAPKIAIITNIYNDHLNRYSSFEEYASIKAKIFQNQTENDYLILNLDNEWTNFFLNLKPKSQVYFVSLRGLPQTKRRQFGQVKVRGGIYIKNEKVFICDTSPGLEPDMLPGYQPDGTPGLKPDISGDHPGNLSGRYPGKILDNKSGKHPGDKSGNHPGKSIIFRDYELFSIKKFKEIYGEHNLYNLLFALLAVYLYLKSKNIKNPQDKIKKLKNFILNLKTPKFRQEIVYKDKNLMIVNDSAATSPDATINAIERFKKYKDLILITGGTDKNLDFEELAKKIKKEIKPENLILLNGSATKKLIEELRKIKYPLIEENIFEDLREAIHHGLMRILKLINADSKQIGTNKNDPYRSVLNPHTSVILFSPASASFEKFKNEFDRGKKFNKIINGMLKLVYGRNKK
jgi:UDP-N-acetylmuramoylalanine-D-glutamate ligase